MILPLKEIQWMEFKEHPVKFLSHKQIESFDIFIEEMNERSFNHQIYCIKLIRKLFSLKKKNRNAFFDYQCSLVLEPWSWLNSVYLLLDYNWRIFIKRGQRKNLLELIDMVEDLRNKYPRVTSSFHEFSRIIETGRLPRYSDDKTTIWIWNSPVNVLVDIFYQMLTIKAANGRPLIQTTKNEVADFVVKHFRKVDGKKISRSTVLTILTPSKVDKRPSRDKRIDLKKIIDGFKK